MKILIIGRSGQLGKALYSRLINKYNIICIGSRTKKLYGNLINSRRVAKTIIRIKPEYIINCAAYTNVDKAVFNKKRVKQINSDSLIDIAKAAKKINAILIHYSTDYVYGCQEGLLNEKDQTDPINFYGYTKLLAEKNISKFLKKFLIIRVSWLYSNNKNNFIGKIINNYNNKKIVYVVNDQIGTPTSVDFISNYTNLIIDKINKSQNFKFWGIYNLSPNGYVNRFKFAKKIISVFLKLKLIRKKNIKILPISSDKFKFIEKRQLNSVFDKKKIKNTFKIKIIHWEEDLISYIKNQYEK